MSTFMKMSADSQATRRSSQYHELARGYLKETQCRCYIWPSPPVCCSILKNLRIDTRPGKLWFNCQGIEAISILLAAFLCTGSQNTDEKCMEAKWSLSPTAWEYCFSRLIYYIHCLCLFHFCDEFRNILNMMDGVGLYSEHNQFKSN